MFISPIVTLTLSNFTASEWLQPVCLHENTTFVLFLFRSILPYVSLIGYFDFIETHFEMNCEHVNTFRSRHGETRLIFSHLNPVMWLYLEWQTYLLAFTQQRVVTA